MWPVMAPPAPPAMPVVGVLHQSRFNERRRTLIEALRKGLAETGIVQGLTVRSNTCGRRIATTGCRVWLLSLFAGK